MSNRELPMMPWYPDQFAASTAGWTFTERAVYRALLDLQWAQVRIPDSEVRIAKACDLHIHHFRRAWKTVKAKFPRAPDGSGLQNFRLEQHRVAALKYIDGKRKGAQATNAKRWSQSESLSDRSAIAQRVASESPLSPSEEVRTPPTPSRGPNGASAPSRRGPERIKRDASREAWAIATIPIDHVRETARLPAELRLTWAYVEEQVDPVAWEAIQQVGGCRVIAERDRNTEEDLKQRFREAYEQRLRQEQQHDAPSH